MSPSLPILFLYRRLTRFFPIRPEVSSPLSIISTNVHRHIQGKKDNTSLVIESEFLTIGLTVFDTPLDSLFW